MDNNVKLVTLKTFDQPTEAHILRSKLESEDIPCFLFDENIVSVNPLYSQTVGGVKLKIREQDAMKALRILSVIDNTALTDENGKPISCPRCKSHNFYSAPSVRDASAWRVIVAAVMGLFIPTKNVKHCRECGEEFETMSRD